MNMCRWACGHIPRELVRDNNTRERLKVGNITEMCRKARQRSIETWRDDASEEILWRWHQLGEEEEDEIGYGCIV